MKLVQWSPDELGTLSSFVQTTRPTYSDSTLTQQTEAGTSFSDTVKAMVRRENLTIDIAENLHRRATAEGDFEEADPSWNPHAYIRENWSEEDKAYFEIEQRQGIFDQAMNAAQLDTLREKVRREKLLLEQIDGGSMLGVLAGGFVAAATDLSSYIPVAGQIQKIRQLGPIARGALLGTTAMAIPELGLQATQELRTAQESFMNIGVGAALGAGMGGFARLLSPKHPLNPANPVNPLRRENLDAQGVGVRTPDGSEEIIESTVGAARVDRSGPRAEPGLTSNVPFLNRLTEKITGVTPVGRALQWTGGRSRDILVRLMDLGGVLTNTARFGKRIGPSAEDLKKDLLTYRDRLFLFGDKLHRNLNLAMGQTKTENLFGLRNRITEDQLNDITRRKLNGTWTEEDNLSLVREYGETNARLINQTAEQYAEKVHEVNGLFEEEMIELGMLQDPERVSKLKSDLDAIRRQLEGDGTQGVEPRPELRAERDRIRAELQAELSKPAPMGRDYGHAQMWDASKILSSEEEFTDFLLEVLVDRPNDDWLFETFDITPEQWARLGSEEVEINGTSLTPEEGARKRAEILREWAGDEYLFNINRAELQAEAAEGALKQSTLDLQDMLRALGYARTTTERLKLSEARKFRDQFNGQVETTRAEREVQAGFVRALKDAAEAARTLTLDRSLADLPVGRSAITDAENAVTAAEDALLKEIREASTDPASADSFWNSGAYQKRVAEVAQAKARLDNLYARSPEPIDSVRRARVEERARSAQRELARLDNRLARLQERQAKLERLHQEVEARYEKARAAKSAITDAVTEARRVRRIAEKDLRKVKRILAKAQKQTPLDEVVSDIRLALMNRENLPHSMLDKIAVETGRAKKRRIILNPEQRRKGEELGFLRTDLPNILNAQYDQLAGHIGLHRGLDIRKGGEFGSWQDVLRAVDEEYDALTRGKDPETVKRLNAERAGVKKDMTLLKNRLLGTENVGADKDGWAYWMSGKVRQANFIRFGAGFLLPSLTDIASVTLRTGSFAKLAREHGREAVRIMSGMSESELRALVNSTELGANGVRMAQLFDADDAVHMFGIGADGTFKKRFTSQVDRGARWLSEKTNLVSGMRAWNRFWRIAAGIQVSYRLRDLARKWDSLTDLEKADMASLGIGKAEASRIAKYIEKFGQTDANGHWDPRLSEWMSTKDGREAARDFRIAVERTMSRAVYSPGIGDTPGVMSHALGKMFLQFQTYAFTFLNRFMIPASQRVYSHKDATAMVAFAHLIWAGMVVVIGKDLLRGEDPMKRFEDGQWVSTTYDIIDRSGVLAYMSPYVDSLLKLTSPIQEELLGDSIAPSRFSRNRWWESSLGASYGLVRDIGAFGSSIFAEDPSTSDIVKKGLLLTPANFYWRLMNSFAED